MNEHAAKAEFNIGQMLRDAWEVFTGNPVLYVGAFLVFFIIIFAVSSFTYGIGAWILGGPLAYGLYKICMAGVQKTSTDFGDAFSGFQIFLPTFLTGLVVSVFTYIGFFLLIIPGLLVNLVYLPVYLIILDGEREFWQAMEKSRKLVMNNFGQWAILFLIMIAINIVGALLCGLGLLVTGPLSCILICLAYEQERQGPAIVDVPAEEVPPTPDEDE